MRWPERWRSQPHGSPEHRQRAQTACCQPADASLAKLIEPYLETQEDHELRSLTLATNTLNVREIAMEHWFRNGGSVSVIDCFNKALAVNHAINQLELPRSLSLSI